MYKINRHFLIIILITLFASCSSSDKENVVISNKENDSIENQNQDSGEKLTVVSEGNYPDIKYGVKNSNNDLVVPYKYDDIRDFNEGLARVELNGKYGFINETGQLVIPIQYANASQYFKNGFATVYSQNGGKYGFINAKGVLITPMVYEEEYYGGGGWVSDGETWPGYFSNGYARVIKNGKFGIINTKGKEVVPCIYTDIYRSDFYGSLDIFPVKKGDKFGYVNLSGEEIIPCKIDADAAQLFEGNNAIAWKNNMEGVINKKGEWIVNPEYDFIDLNGDGSIKAEKRGYFKNVTVKYDGNGNLEETKSEYRVLFILTLIFSGLIPIVSLISQFTGKHKKFTFGRILISIWAFIVSAIFLTFIGLANPDDLIYRNDIYVVLPLSIVFCGLVWVLQQDYFGTKIARLIINIIGGIIFIYCLIMMILL